MCFLFACVKKNHVHVFPPCYKMRMLVLELSKSFERAMKREKKQELFTDIWMLELGSKVCPGHGPFVPQQAEVNLNINRAL